MPKPIKLNLVGLDGNAFALMGAFKREAKKEGWTEAEVRELFSEAMSADYHHLVATLAGHCEMGSMEEAEKPQPKSWLMESE